tara:strand:+ start:568 stop:774 length:207 start_codon:yes stop_codon:yes gene_type:complete
MWYIFNYFFIGVAFTFIVDLFLSMAQNNPKVKNVSEDWDYEQRIACTILWPIGFIWFLIALIKNYLNK